MSIRARRLGHGDRLRVDTPVDLSDNTGVQSNEVLEEEEGFDEDEDDERRLLEAIANSDAQIARGEVIPAEEALARLRSRRGA
jgi:hypothetical protein